MRQGAGAAAKLGLQGALKKASDATRALQQGVQAAPGGRQPLLCALCTLPKLRMLRYRVAMHLQHHTQQRLRRGQTKGTG